MRLTLENIAKVRKADVEINGITVIAGENNTGKSTVGKALYSVFNSLYHVENQIREERVRTISNFLDGLYLRAKQDYINISATNRRAIAERLIENYYEQSNQVEYIKSVIVSFLSKEVEQDTEALKSKEVDEISCRIKEVLEVSDDEILKLVLVSKLNSEFNRQINNIYHDGKGTIYLAIRKEQTEIVISGNFVKEIQKPISLQTEVVYLDDPFVLDESGSFVEMNLSNFVRRTMRGDHRSDVREKLINRRKESTTIDEILINRKLKRIYEKLDEICDGQIIPREAYGFGYKRKDSNKILDVKNISTGLKTFVILKTLLINGILKENGTIILDEPEIHLHPQWQLLFAELIVLIQKEFHIHILLNTHSPYFLQAIEVYAAKYEIADKCKYYLAQLDGDMAVISDVSDSTETIYKLLAKPFQNLENVRYEND
mgnify:FL=1